VLTFLLGLAIGGGLCLLQRRQFSRSLKHVVNSLPDRRDDNLALPAIARLRQQIDRAQARGARAEAEAARWQEVLDRAPLGYLQVDAEDRLVWCNRQARELLHVDRWQPGQVRLLLEVVRSYELDRLVAQVRRTQEPRDAEWVFQSTDVSPQRWFDAAPTRATRSLTLRAAGWPLPGGDVGVFLEDRQPLVELTQDRDRALIDLAHELRTPLTSIRLVAETLQGRLQPPERTWVEQALQETNRLIRFVEDWLAVSQGQERALQVESVAVRSLVESAWESLEPLARQQRLVLDYAETDALVVEGDRARLLQVLLNLFDNAIKFSPARGTVQVRVKTAGDRVWLDVIDAGEGFAEDDLPHAFERLYKGEPPEAEAATPSGVGLGLAIARQIVSAHGGTIRAQNHPETGGAWLQIELPQATGAEEE